MDSASRINTMKPSSIVCAICGALSLAACGGDVEVKSPDDADEHAEHKAERAEDKAERAQDKADEARDEASEAKDAAQ
jgi:hypothetical protein